MITIPAGTFIMVTIMAAGGKTAASCLSSHLSDWEYEVTRGSTENLLSRRYNDPKYWSAEGWVWKEGNVIVYAGMYGKVSYSVRSDTKTKRSSPDHWDAEQEWIGHDYGHPVLSRQTGTRLSGDLF